MGWGEEQWTKAMMCQKMFSALLSAVLFASRALATNSRYQAIPGQAKTFINVIKREINLNRKVGVRHVLQNAFPPEVFGHFTLEFIDFLLFRQWLLVCTLHLVFGQLNCMMGRSLRPLSTQECHSRIWKEICENKQIVDSSRLAFYSVTYPSAYFHYLRHESAAT